MSQHTPPCCQKSSPRTSLGGLNFAFRVSVTGGGLALSELLTCLRHRRPLTLSITAPGTSDAEFTPLIISCIHMCRPNRDNFSLPLWNTFGGQLTSLRRASHWGHMWRKELGWLELLYSFFRQAGWTRIFHHLESCNLVGGGGCHKSLWGPEENSASCPEKKMYMHRN